MSIKYHTHKGELWVYLDESFPEIDIDYDKYSECEQKVISPALVQAGFDLAWYETRASEIRYNWQTGEGDSFGPLSRYIRATHEDRPGQAINICYG